MDRVSDSDSEGHRFESCRAYIKEPLRNCSQGLFFSSGNLQSSASRASAPLASAFAYFSLIRSMEYR